MNLNSFLFFFTLNLFINSISIFSIIPVEPSDLPLRRDYRELMTSVISLQHNIQKNVEYHAHILVPGYIRPAYSNVHTVQDDGATIIKAKRTHKWVSGRPVLTEDPLNFALDAENKAFFTIQLPNDVIGYTRDGRFRIDLNNNLVTVAGNHPVIGTKGPIKIYGHKYDITCSKSGSLYDRSQFIDKLKIAVFPSIAHLDKLTSVNSVVFVLLEPMDLLNGDEHYGVLQGYIEQSNTFSAFDSWFEKNAYEVVAKTYYDLIDKDKQLIQAAEP